jgi:hypothetical protein
MLDSVLLPRMGPGARTQRISVREGEYAYKAEWVVPLEPTNVFAFSPSGYFITANQGHYALTQHMRDGSLVRVELDRLPVPVDDLERADLLTQDNWTVGEMGGSSTISLNDIPRVKPHFRSILVARDGRIWVRIRTPGTRIALTPRQLENYSAINPALDRMPRPTHQWQETTAFDVFEPAGDFVGTVALPERSIFAAANGDLLWLVVLDDFDVPTLVRFRIRP